MQAPLHLSRTPQEESDAVTGRWFSRLAAFLLFLLPASHVIAVWGYTGFWNDAGRWRHEIERFAAGEMFYIDFSHDFPPLSMWLFGYYARHFGAHVEALFAATSVVCLLIFAIYHNYLSALVDRRLLPLGAVAASILALAYAFLGGESMPAGLYTPAALLGFLCLIITAIAAIKTWHRRSVSACVVLGISAGLCFLAKQDFWLPALYLVAVTIMRKGPQIGVPSIALVAAFGSTILIGAFTVILQAGISVLPGVVQGFGHAGEFVAAGFPSWERLLGEWITLLLLAVGAVTTVLIAGKRSSQWVQSITFSGGLLLVSSAIYVACTTLMGSETTFDSLFRSTVALGRVVQLHLFPALLPISVAVFLWLRRKRLDSSELGFALFLLGLCVTARCRRLFQYVEWYHILLELPVYLFIIQFLMRSRSVESYRPVQIGLIGLILVGLGSYWMMGLGPLTRSGVRQEVSTAKGQVRWKDSDLKHYSTLVKVLNSADSQGARPLFAFGQTGGFNYYLNRSNPTPLNHGFFLSRWPAAEMVSLLRSQSPRPIFVDTNYYDPLSVPQRSIDFRRWALKRQDNVYVRFDRIYFAAAVEGCPQIEKIPGDHFHFTIYDCDSYASDRP